MGRNNICCFTLLIKSGFGAGRVVVHCGPNHVPVYASVPGCQFQRVGSCLIPERDISLHCRRALGDSHNISLLPSIKEKLAHLVGHFADDRIGTESALVRGEIQDSRRNVKTSFGPPDEQCRRCGDSSNRPDTGGGLLYIYTRITHLHAYVALPLFSD